MTALRRVFEPALWHDKVLMPPHVDFTLRQMVCIYFSATRRCVWECRGLAHEYEFKHGITR